MTSAKAPIQVGIVDQCRVALATLGISTPTQRVFAHRAPERAKLPLVIVGTATETRGLHSDKDEAEAEGTHTVRCYSDDPDQADAIAAEVTKEVTENLTIPGFRIQDVQLDLRTSLPETDPAAGDVYGEIARFRIRTIKL